MATSVTHTACHHIRPSTIDLLSEASAVETRPPTSVIHSPRTTAPVAGSRRNSTTESASGPPRGTAARTRLGCGADVTRSGMDTTRVWAKTGFGQGRGNSAAIRRSARIAVPPGSTAMALVKSAHRTTSSVAGSAHSSATRECYPLLIFSPGGVRNAARDARLPAMVADSMLQIRGLTVRYGRQVALEDVTFDLPSGTSTALVGANGSGKSTLLNAIAGLLAPAAGSVEPSGVHCAYVLQHTSNDTWIPLTVDEVLQMGRYRGRRRFSRLLRGDRDAIDSAAARMDVETLRRLQFSQLSAGQRQRVLVAQALAQQAPILLMDEPITGLDMPSQSRILDVIEEETNAENTVVISTHQLDEAHHCTQVAVLANRLLAVGPPAEVLTPEVLRAAYEGQMSRVHAGHDHPAGIILLDEHGHAP